MKKIIIAGVVVASSVAGVCLAGTNNGVSSSPNPTSVPPSGPNSAYTNSTYDHARATDSTDNTGATSTNSD
jgi:hypothetical protein